jgi:hypothetical protein
LLLALKQLLTKMDNKITNMQDKLTDLDTKFSDLKTKQSEMERDLKRQGQDTEPDIEEGEGFDRKRLKERFKKALLLDSGPLASIPKAPSAWMEFIFGIGAPDQRVGKEGSRSSPQLDGAAGSRARTDELCHGRLIHPSSLFIQGWRPHSDNISWQRQRLVSLPTVFCLP